jgi:glycosyl transferase family 9 (putative heptosyltransferase)
VLLLRRLIAALRRGGREVTLLAPAWSGAALVGPGPSEVDRLIDWERADVAGLAADGGPVAKTLRREFATCDLAFVFTRSEAVARNLEALVGRVFVRDPQPPAAVHAAQWLARDASGDVEAVPPSCVATPEEQERARDFARRLPARFLAVHPGSGSRRKNWPSFVDLVGRVRPPEPWLLVCGPADEEAAAPLRPRPAAVVAGHLPVRVLGAVLASAGVFVGNDSGISHLAAAWGAPTVALFGPTDARTWAPEGARVRTVQSRSGDMAGIGVGEVMDAMTAAQSA